MPSLGTERLSSVNFFKISGFCKLDLTKRIMKEPSDLNKNLNAARNRRNGDEKIEGHQVIKTRLCDATKIKHKAFYKILE